MKSPSLKKSQTKKSIEKLSEIMNYSSKTPVKKVKITSDHDLKSILKKTPLKSSVSVAAVPQTTRSASRNRSMSRTRSTGGTQKMKDEIAILKDYQAKLENEMKQILDGLGNNDISVMYDKYI